MTGKDLTEIDFLLAKPDAPAPGDHDGFIVEGIVDVRQSGVRAVGRLVDLRRALHVQGFVRTLVVEDLHELVEASLLLQKIGSRRLPPVFWEGVMPWKECSVMDECHPRVR